MGRSGKLFMRPQGGYFGVYFLICETTMEWNTKIYFGWAHKYFVKTYVLPYIGNHIQGECLGYQIQSNNCKRICKNVLLCICRTVLDACGNGKHYSFTPPPPLHIVGVYSIVKYFTDSPSVSHGLSKTSPDLTFFIVTRIYHIWYQHQLHKHQVTRNFDT